MSNTALTRVNTKSSDTSPATRGEGLEHGFVPPSKVIPLSDIAKRINLMRKMYPIQSIDDLVCQYNIRKEVVLKAQEGFDCLIEIYHLYGLYRPARIPSFKETGLDPVTYYNTYISDIENNRLYKWRIQSAVKRLLEYLSQENDDSLWVAYFKYKTCAFFAYYEQQDIPPSPKNLIDNPKVIFFPEYVTLLKRSNREKFLSFLMTINQAKMGMPRNCEDQIQIAEEKCARHLTTQPPKIETVKVAIGRDFGEIQTSENSKVELVDPSLVKELNGVDNECFIERFNISKLRMKRQLRRTCRELFKDSHYTKESHYEPCFPSTSSNYNNTRDMMGAVGTVHDLIHATDQTGLNLKHPFELDRDGKFTSQLDLSIQDVFFSYQKSTKYGKRGEVEDAAFNVQAGLFVETRGKALAGDFSTLKTNWKVFMDTLFNEALVEEPYVEPLGLLEPLKIRVISKGPPKLYTLLKPLQKFLWRTLKSQKVFELIGEPVTAEHINDLFGIPCADEIIINGDYKASTDNLHSWVSETIVNEICDILHENCVDGDFPITPEFREMFVRSLTHHKFYIDGEWRDQKEGQLMGSITSFPILCIANAAMCRWAMEISDCRSYRLVDRGYPGSGRIARLKVNGDDCTLVGNRRLLRGIWEAITKFGGLETSLGKTFFSHAHRPICMINSIAFDFNFDSNLWIERKYVNMGLLLGKKRSGTEKTEVSYSRLGEIHRKLHQTVPQFLWKEVSKRFIYYFGNTLAKYKNIPWDMPEYLGGPGLVPDKPRCELDLRCATLLKMNMKRHGFHDQSLKVEKPVLDKNWLLHELVSDRFSAYEKDGVSQECEFEAVRQASALEMGFISLDEIDLFQDLNTQLYGDVLLESVEDVYSMAYKYATVETLFTKTTNELRQTFDKLAIKQQVNRERRVLTRNDRSWANARKICFSTQMEVMEESEVDHEKKDFVVAFTTLGANFYDQFAEDFGEVNPLRWL